MSLKSGSASYVRKKSKTFPTVFQCSYLKDRTAVLLRFASDSLSNCVQARALFLETIGCKDDTKKVQMLLDPSAIPDIIQAK